MWRVEHRSIGASRFSYIERFIVCGGICAQCTFGHILREQSQFTRSERAREECEFNMQLKLNAPPNESKLFVWTESHCKLAQSKEKIFYGIMADNMLSHSLSAVFVRYIASFREMKRKRKKSERKSKLNLFRWFSIKCVAALPMVRVELSGAHTHLLSILVPYFQFLLLTEECDKLQRAQPIFYAT